MLTKPMDDLMGPESIGISIEGVVGEAEMIVSLCALPNKVACV